ncbi:MAG: hypothetical protein J5970_03750 [Bacilli bacterium]|nr:hypothetical protein [Bacilli bacterium]
MLEKYIEEQPIVTKLLLNSFENNKLVQAYLFVSNDKSFLLDYALAFSKKLITENYDEKICNMIDNNNYPELKIIEPTNNIIKKEQLLDLQQSFQVKPTLGDKLVYIICGADKLHVSSANTILKFLEEPSENIVAILLTDNLNKVLPTIKSRCQNLIFKNKKEEELNKLDILLNEYKSKVYDKEDYVEQFNNLKENMVSFIKQIEKLKIKEFIHFKDSIFDIYKTKDEINILFDFMLYFYYDMLNFMISRKVIYMNDYLEDMKKIAEISDIDKIQRKLQLIENTKIKLETNMNLKLLMDEFIIKFSEV